MFERRSAVSALEFPSILSPSRSRSPTPQSLSPPNDPARYREDLPGGESDRCHRSIRERGKSLFSPPLSRRATERATLVRRRSARRVNPPRGERDVFGSWPLSLSLSLLFCYDPRSTTRLLSLPSRARSLRRSISECQWVTTGKLAALGILSGQSSIQLSRCAGRVAAMVAVAGQ